MGELEEEKGSNRRLLRYLSGLILLEKANRFRQQIIIEIGQFSRNAAIPFPRELEKPQKSLVFAVVGL